VQHRVVDTHCHVSRKWYEPVETLVATMERHGIDHAVLIQMWGEVDNDYEFECVRRYPGLFAPVVRVDVSSPDALDQLARLAELGASGVRLEPSDRSPGQDPIAIWRHAAMLELPVSCSGNADHYLDDHFAALIQELPDLVVVLEHLGVSLVAPGCAPLADAGYESRSRVFDLARFPNVYVKASPLGEFAKRAVPLPDDTPFELPVPPFLGGALEAFGADRMMWGSDFPRVSANEGYGLGLSLPVAMLAGAGEDAVHKVFGETALTVFTPR
jgi:L-fuconolactonase